MNTHTTSAIDPRLKDPRIRFVSFARRAADRSVSYSPTVPAGTFATGAELVAVWGGGEYHLIAKDENRRILFYFPGPQRWLLFAGEPKSMVLPPAPLPPPVYQDPHAPLLGTPASRAPASVAPVVPGPADSTPGEIPIALNTEGNAIKLREHVIPVYPFGDGAVLIASHLDAALGYQPGGVADLLRGEWKAEVQKGTHYLVLEGENLRRFKASAKVTGATPVSSPAAFARHLMVLTEAGVDRVTFLTRKPQGVAIRDYFQRVAARLRRGEAVRATDHQAAPAPSHSDPVFDSLTPAHKAEIASLERIGETLEAIGATRGDLARRLLPSPPALVAALDDLRQRVAAIERAIARPPAAPARVTFPPADPLPAPSSLADQILSAVEHTHVSGVNALVRGLRRSGVGTRRDEVDVKAKALLKDGRLVWRDGALRASDPRAPAVTPRDPATYERPPGRSLAESILATVQSADLTTVQAIVDTLAVPGRGGRRPALVTEVRAMLKDGRLVCVGRVIRPAPNAGRAGR